MRLRQIVGDCGRSWQIAGDVPVGLVGERGRRVLRLVLAQQQRALEVPAREAPHDRRLAGRLALRLWEIVGDCGRSRGASRLETKAHRSSQASRSPPSHFPTRGARTGAQHRNRGSARWLSVLCSARVVSVSLHRAVTLSPPPPHPHRRPSVPIVGLAHLASLFCLRRLALSVADARVRAAAVEQRLQHVRTASATRGDSGLTLGKWADSGRS